MRYLLLLLILGVVLVSCFNPPEFEPVPKIEFEKLTRQQVDQLDTFSILISFEDNGDLTLETEELDTASCDLCDSTAANSCFQHSTLTLFILDRRTGCLVNTYNIPHIPSKGSTESISGEIKISVSGCCRPPGGIPCAPSSQHPTDSVSYYVQVKDRAGNLSNRVLTPHVVLNCN